ncbi:hypothetical protein MOR33_004459 [Salmonella enterica]|nr:hypothetical protein [Salmonella enterica]EGL7478660.1 hypothetical protein [Salmonella enterica]EIZ2335445.1 hypothetical protein [Salmonella enterica]
MFNVKRNGSNVEITDIPQSIPFSVFKNIADETGANECLVAYVKDKDSYEVVIRHDNVNMAGTAAWLVLEIRETMANGAGLSLLKGGDSAHEVQQLKFKDLPYEIQCIAAKALCRRIVSSNGCMDETNANNIGKRFISLYLSKAATAADYK